MVHRGGRSMVAIGHRPLRLPLTAALCVAAMVPGIPAVAQEPESPSGVRFAWVDDRPSLRLGAVGHVDFRLRLQGDVRQPSDDGSLPPDRFDLRLRRVGTQGVVFRFLEFEIERELRRDDPWRDVFVNARAAPALQVKAGKFKLPFSLDELTAITTLDFVYRSLAANAMAPARDVGVMVHGRLPNLGGARVNYEAGWFRHDGDNARAGQPPFLFPGERPATRGRTVAARARLAPFDQVKRHPLQSLRLGVAATSGALPEGRWSLQGETAFGDTFFPRIFVNGRRLRLGGEASWRVGAATFRAELIRARDDRRGQGVANLDLPPLVSTGWYVSATWPFLEAAKEGGGAVRWLTRGGVGPMELAIRAEQLRYGSGSRGPTASQPELPSVSPRAAALAPAVANVWTFGVNWRPVPLTRVQVNTIRQQIEGREWTERFRAGAAWGVVARFQFAF
jgi:hypothetical protein